MIAEAFGESAVYLDLAIDGATDRAERTHAVALAISRARPDADVVVGGGCVAVHGARDADALAAVARAVLARARVDTPPGRAHVIATTYDGPDLPAIAAATGLTPEGVASRHADREYVVEIVGFLPGFGYLRGLDPRLVVPRRPSPRPRVAAGSVAVASEFTGVYPFASPGGWSLLGRAYDAALFDPARDPVTLFAPGDRVRFEAVPGAPTPRAPAVSLRAGDASPRGGGGGLVVESAPPGSTIQDRGRPGLLARGVPPSGPLDVEAHAAANAAVGNADGAAAIEIPLGRASFLARGEVLASIDGDPARRLRDGDSIVVPPTARAVRYVAIRGGVDVPRAIGARATLLVAGLGGLGGLSLRAGDVLLAGDEAPMPTSTPASIEDPRGSIVIDVDAGPHARRFPAGALDALAAVSWRVSHLGDRVGVRLEGDRVPREGADLALPAPMIRGAIQIATDGTPIVLGPDHPATGGYPVLATLRRSSQPLFARLRPGAALRLRLA